MNTDYGFTWGPAEVSRCCVFPKETRVLVIKTPKCKELSVYIAKTGKIRVYGPDSREWKPK